MQRIFQYRYVMEKSVTAELTNKIDLEKESAEAVEKFGSVQVSAFYPHILFINSVDRNSSSYIRRALAKAKFKYGET